MDLTPLSYDISGTVVFCLSETLRLGRGSCRAAVTVFPYSEDAPKRDGSDEKNGSLPQISMARLILV